MQISKHRMSDAQAFQQSSLYDQLLDLPGYLIGEILNGELHTQPRPSGRHGLAESGLTSHIGGPFNFGRGGPGGWWIIPEPEIHFIRDVEVVVPDQRVGGANGGPPFQRISASR